MSRKNKREMHTDTTGLTKNKIELSHPILRVRLRRLTLPTPNNHLAQPHERGTPRGPPRCHHRKQPKRTKMLKQRKAQGPALEPPEATGPLGTTAPTDPGDPCTERGTNTSGGEGSGCP